MTVNVKSGGVWRAASDGGLRIKSGGAWRTAAFCYIKSGGAWRLSSYRGYPLAPTDIWIGNNSFTSLDVGLSGPGAGGAPVSRYLVQQLDGAGNYMNQWYTSTGTVAGIPVSQNQTLQYRVLSESAAGLQSGWYGPVANRSRIQIGVTELNHQEARTGTQAWQQSAGFTLRRGQVGGVVAPADVTLTQMYWHVWLNFNGNYLSKSTSQGNRQMYNYFGNANYDAYVIPASGTALGTWDTEMTQGLPGWAGAGAVWGIWIDGIGWSPPGGNDAQLLAGGVTLSGTQPYTYYVTVIDRSYRANALY